ncbi:uncharacterized protein LOC132724626 [Ruditapes philippinarum]|uniref:uncharacterized protein LOC132724626 n=1 Tax=Ruditapes philippinarum TaxID=129788 RepID=UPI00295C32C0|nr:uncharacterized protein LOC132724626 [Ruditapes philippinarum]
MSSSRVNYELNMTWAICEMRKTYGPFNATLNRKRLATKMATISPLLSRQMAKQLRHALNTHQKYYKMVHGPDEAAKVIHEARKTIQVQAEVHATEQGQEGNNIHEARNSIQVKAEVHATEQGQEGNNIHGARNTIQVKAEVHAPEQGQEGNKILEETSPPHSPGQL